MPSKSQLPPKDRAARSRLVQLLTAAQPVARASLVTMARVCGKKTCKCAQGEKHVSLYLAARVGRKRKMLYVPPDLEEEARRLVKNAKTVEELLEEMSQASLEHLAEQKAKRSAGRTTRP
jgi:DNA-dependent RNA polymerase auxiliary subunit epsilon